MKKISFLFTIILFSCVTKNILERTIYVKEIGWQFKLNNNLLIKDSAFDSRGNLIDSIPINGPSLKILSINDSTDGYFATWIRKDTLNFNDWKIWHDKDTHWYFDQSSKIATTTLIDSNYYTTKIDSVLFLEQHIKFVRKNQLDTCNSYHYFGKYNDIEFDFGFAYYNSKSKYQYEKLLFSSHFLNKAFALIFSE